MNIPDVDDPIWDATDGAHPAWWRGHDHAAQKMQEALDKARAEATAYKRQLISAGLIPDFELNL